MMNKLFGFLVLLALSMANILYATEIKCFSGGRIVYKANIKNMQYNDYYLSFTDEKTKNHIIVFGDCILINRKK